MGRELFGGFRQGASLAETGAGWLGREAEDWSEICRRAAEAAAMSRWGGGWMGKARIEGQGNTIDTSGLRHGIGGHSNGAGVYCLAKTEIIGNLLTVQMNGLKNIRQYGKMGLCHMPAFMTHRSVIVR
jgi:hypothetical protein